MMRVGLIVESYCLCLGSIAYLGQLALLTPPACWVYSRCPAKVSANHQRCCTECRRSHWLTTTELSVASHFPLHVLLVSATMHALECASGPVSRGLVFRLGCWLPLRLLLPHHTQSSWVHVSRTLQANGCMVSMVFLFLRLCCVTCLIRWLHACMWLSVILSWYSSCYE